MDAALSALVRSRAGGLCEYCHLPQQFSELRFHVEHIIPRQHGGKDAADNLALACPDCNLAKGPNLTGVDPETQRVVRLFHPRRDKWPEHFVLEGALIVGKTPVGRVTVFLLRMNDGQRQRVRALLAAL
jgi:5-methylcytosine-specific restriction endonuclease McrA